MKKNVTRKKLISSLPLLLMLFPGVAYLFINNYLPMFGVVIAFKKINYSIGILQSKWNGLDNFDFLIKSKDAYLIFRNTICYNLVFIVLGTILSIAVAVLLSEVQRKKIQQFAQTSILIPFLLSSVMLSYIVFAFLGSETGVLNKIRESLDLNAISWYTKASAWPLILTIVYLWKSFGYTSIIYFATILGIDKSLYEAAAVDGASAWKQLWNITMPCLKPAIIILTLLSLGRIFNSDFGLFYQVPMNSGPLINVTNTLDTYVYRGLLELNDPGRSAAAGFLQSCLGFVVVYGVNALTRRREKELALF